MSEIQRRPLPPIGKGGSISPEDVKAYTDDLLRSAWDGATSYYPDGGLKDFDDRIDGLSSVMDQLSALQQRIPASPGRDALDAMIQSIRDAQAELRNALSYSQFEGPYTNEPRLARPDYGPFINPESAPRKRSQTNIRSVESVRRFPEPQDRGGLLGFMLHSIPTSHTGFRNGGPQRTPGGLLGSRWRTRSAKSRGST